MKRSPKSWHRPFHPLNEYVKFKSISILEDYLLDKLDFYGASLKFKARSNTLALDRKKNVFGIKLYLVDVPFVMKVWKI